MNPLIRVVIVNYRTASLTLDCLASLEPEVRAHLGLSVEVVEGGSGDDSEQVLRQAIASRGWDDWVQLNVQHRNAGFAGGNNAAIRPALGENPPPDYLLLLNPDTVVRPNAIRPLWQFMEERPEVGLVGSRLEDPDGTPQCSAFRFPSVASSFENALRVGLVSRLLRRFVVALPIRDQPHQADWLAGASLMVRREVFEKVGVLDEGYFMYFEETDFCRAARKAGFEVWYLPESRVVHLVGQASGVTAKQEQDRPARRRPAYWFESRRRYFLKNHGAVRTALADLAWAVGFACHRLRTRLGRRPDRDPEHLLADFIRQSVFFKGFHVPGTDR